MNIACNARIGPWGVGNMRLLPALPICLLLSACGSTTLPASVSLPDGKMLVGTTTASLSAGTFEVAAADNSLECSGNYDQYSTARILTAPFTCSDGRTGVMSVLRTPDLRAGTGNATLSDGTQARVSFGRLAGATYAALSTDPTSALASTLPSSRVYTGNCPTPDSLDAAGNRCGARSAASRPGGYDGYGRWERTPTNSGGSIRVRGYYRKDGTYVRPHTRRRKRY